MEVLIEDALPQARCSPHGGAHRCPGPLRAHVGSHPVPLGGRRRSNSRLVGRPQRVPIVSTNNDVSYDRTVAIVRDVIPRMSELKIPITPSNYAVWFAYLSVSNQALHEEVDALIARQRPITDSEMEALCQRYLTERSKQLQVARSALGQRYLRSPGRRSRPAHRGSRTPGQCPRARSGGMPRRRGMRGSVA